MVENKINLLVIPGLFPQHPGDISGIFVLDYLKAVKEYCNITVLDIRLIGEKKGLGIENFGNIPVYRYVVASENSGKIMKYFLYLKWYYKGWKTGLSIKNFDLIHAHGSTLSGTLALLIARKSRTPVVITEHTGPFAKLIKNKVSRFLTKVALEHSNAVFTVSEDLKQQIMDSSIFPKKIFVTYNPVDVELFNTSDKMDPTEAKNIIYVGRLEKYKGCLRALLAFQKIVRKHDNWMFTIVGDGPELSDIQKLLGEDPVMSNKIVLKGKLGKEKIPQEMKKSSFFVCPSEHETFGIVIAEAMACGLPVIVGDGTAPKEFVDIESGILVPPFDIDAIARAMEYIIEHHSAYNSELIRQKIVKKFGFEEFGRRLNQIYREFV